MAEEFRRAALLDATTEYVFRHGLAGQSLRPMAEAAGTSARMLIHHFGSKEELLAAILKTARQRNSKLLGTMTAKHPGSSMDVLLRAMWKAFSQPKQEIYLRLVFELHGAGSQKSAALTEFAETATTEWVEWLEQAWRRQGLARREARCWAALSFAVLRGLCLHRLATGERAVTRASLDAFLALLPSPGKPPASH